MGKANPINADGSDAPLKRLEVVLDNRTSLITPCLNSRNELVKSDLWSDVILK